MGKIFACDLDSRQCKQPLEGVREDATCDADEAKLIAEEYHASLMSDLSLEELEKLIAEAGERSLELSYLNMGEVCFLMKHTDIVTRVGDNVYVDLPSGTLCYGEFEDGVIELLGAELVEKREEPESEPTVYYDGEDEDYICAHCAETETLDSDGLCPSCARTQEAFDDGECPRCGTPSPGSRECYNC